MPHYGLNKVLRPCVPWPQGPPGRPHCGLGTHERLSEAQAVFRQLDLDRDGRVSFSEFVMHRQRQHWVRLRAKKALSTRSEGQVAKERLVTAKLHSNITHLSQLQTAESMRGWGG